MKTKKNFYPKHSNPENKKENTENKIEARETNGWPILYDLRH